MGIIFFPTNSVKLGKKPIKYSQKLTKSEKFTFIET